MLDLYTEQIVGFYDPATKMLYVVDGAKPDQLGFVIEHELVHALQDQYTNLDSLLHIKGDDDRVLAAQSVMEGQATLVPIQATPRPRRGVSRRVGQGARNDSRESRARCRSSRRRRRSCRRR